MNVKTLCLGFLSTREATGYEIKKEFEEGLFSHFIEASYGSIYPALNQLAVEGLVTVREEEQSGKPDKKIYAVTDTGNTTLAKWLSVAPASDKYKSEYLFVMLLQNYLTPAQQLVATERQLADLQADLAKISEAEADMTDKAEGCRFVMGYGKTVLTASVTYLEQKLKEMKSLAQSAAE